MEAIALWVGIGAGIAALVTFAWTVYQHRRSRTTRVTVRVDRNTGTPRPMDSLKTRAVDVTVINDSDFPVTVAGLRLEWHPPGLPSVRSTYKVNSGTCVTEIGPHSGSTCTIGVPTIREVVPHFSTSDVLVAVAILSNTTEFPSEPVVLDPPRVGYQ